jgi:hypothetical protein
MRFWQSAANNIAILARMSGDHRAAKAAWDRTATPDGPETIRPIATSLSIKNMRDSNIFVHENQCGHGDDIRSAGTPPRLVFQLGHVPTEIALNCARLLTGDHEVVPLDPAVNTKPFEAHQGAAEMFDARAFNAERGARDRGEANERSNFDVVGSDRVCRATSERPPSMVGTLELMPDVP